MKTNKTWGIFMLLDHEKISFANLTESGYTLTESEINRKYEEGELRIVTEQGRYPLQNIREILSKDIKFNPDYQRRRVWSNSQKSRLIESFIMNVPIPPVFLYEVDFARYEVMDGLQRLSTLYEFYADKIELSGLIVWKELNGLTYSKLPELIRRGIDRRYLSTVVVLKESSKHLDEELMLKTYVFERLNTGGTKLTDQETRNALFDGPMNKLTKKIASECKILHNLWHIKPLEQKDLINDENQHEFYQNEEEEENKKVLMRMEDIELVLRYFAYRQIKDNPTNKVKDFLDVYLRKANETYTQEILDNLEILFYKAHEFAYRLLGKSAFYMFTPNKSEKFSWNKRPSKVIYDPLMYVLSEFINDDRKMSYLLEIKSDLKIHLEDLYKNFYKEFSGRNNNKSDVLKRITLFEEMFNNLLGDHK